MIGVMPDEYVQRKKGANRPILSQTQRVQAIDAMPGVDFTLPLDGAHLAVIKAIWQMRPDVYVEETGRDSRAKRAF